MLPILHTRNLQFTFMEKRANEVIKEFSAATGKISIWFILWILRHD